MLMKHRSNRLLMLLIALLIVGALALVMLRSNFNAQAQAFGAVLEARNTQIMSGTPVSP